MKINIVKTGLLIIFMATLGITGYLSCIWDGIGFRLPGYEFEKYARLRWNEPISPYGSAQSFVDRCDFIYAEEGNQISSECYTKDASIENQVMLWGDSYAQMLTYGLIKHLPSNWQLLQVASRGCQPSIFEAEGSNQNYCKQSNYFAMQTIAMTQPKVVIVSQNANLNKENAQLFTKKLHSLGVKRVIFVGKPPQWIEPLPKLVFRSMPTPIHKYSRIGLRDEIVYKDQYISGVQLGLSKPDGYLSLIESLCNSYGCMVFVGQSPEEGITALDVSHLTPSSSSYIAEQYLWPLLLQGN